MLSNWLYVNLHQQTTVVYYSDILQYLASWKGVFYNGHEIKNKFFIGFQMIEHVCANSEEMYHEHKWIKQATASLYDPICAGVTLSAIATLLEHM